MRVGNTSDNLQDETEWTLKMMSVCQTLSNEVLTGMLDCTPSMFFGPVMTASIWWFTIYKISARARK